MKGRTSIVIAHRLSTVRSLDRILVFDRGEIIEQGTHAGLTARPGGLYRGLFEQQATEFSRISAAE
jgi:ATP-binding cassette, subfamily B, bacterial